MVNHHLEAHLGKMINMNIVPLSALSVVKVLWSSSRVIWLVCKVWLMFYSSINLMGQIPIGMELIISCDFLIPNFMKLF
jgi:hypothetical protein